MNILADTRGLIALIDRHSDYHQAARIYADDIIVPSTVLPEFDHVATNLVGARVVRIFYASLATGETSYIAADLADLEHAFDIMDTYQDTPIGLVDASLVTLAERYSLRRILTLDKRHFLMFKPQGLGYLELLP